MKTVTLTRDEVINQIADMADTLLIDVGREQLLIEGDMTLRRFFGLKDKSHDELANLWAEFCADLYLSENPDVEDVLMLTNGFKPGENIQKIWLANKDETVPVKTMPEIAPEKV